MSSLLHRSFWLVLTLAVAACTRAYDPHEDEEAAEPSVEQRAETWATADAPATRPLPPTDASALPLVLVHKSPSCGCCKAWVEHLRTAGFPVEVRDTSDLAGVKTRAGVPAAKGSCHTAEVDGYFVEGHVPADDIQRLLSERPAARGLTLPGMPAGSPGMEVPGVSAERYVVELVAEDGTTTPYAEH